MLFMARIKGGSGGRGAMAGGGAAGCAKQRRGKRKPEVGERADRRAQGGG
jgi:hypothetical protein